MSRAIWRASLLCEFLICVNVIAQTDSSPHDKVVIAFLDDDRAEMANWKPGVAHERLIRPAFERVGSQWQPVNASSLSSPMKWTVSFDGKSLGEIEGRKDSERLTLIQSLTTPASAVPTVGQPSSTFAGLLAMGPTKVRRPLILISEPYFHDPDGWKRLATAPSNVAGTVRSEFRKEFPHVGRCKDEEVVQSDWRFPDSALNLVTVYQSNRHSFLIETDLDAGDCGYIDDPKDPLSSPWFFVSEEGRVHRIGGFMTLLDAGDYDHDGRSEIVFFLSQPEDTDGFILFDASLRELVRFMWHYH